MVNAAALATALSQQGPFTVRYGTDYVLLEDPEGTTVESIVIGPEGAIWGPQDEFTVSSENAQELAGSILYTQRGIA